MFRWILSGLMLSLGWLMRGQFGHEQGASVPGVLAALILSMNLKSNTWRQTFAQTAVWSALGFSLGGGFAFGKLVGQITSAACLLDVMPQLIQVYVIGAVWGGLGMIFLGFSLSRSGKLQERLIFLVSAAIVWMANNLTSMPDLQVLFLGCLIFLWLFLYNRWTHADPITNSFGLIGFTGFGCSFLISVLCLYWGGKGLLPGTWWQVSDMVWGFLGGLTVYSAGRYASNRNYEPRRENRLGSARFGSFVFIFGIPLWNLWDVSEKWFQSQPPAPDLQLAAWILIGFFTVCSAAALFVARAKPGRFDLPRLNGLLLGEALLFCWLMAALAIAKSILYSGWGVWEGGFTVMMILCILFTVLFPFVLLRNELSPLR